MPAVWQAWLLRHACGPTPALGQTLQGWQSPSWSCMTQRSVAPAALCDQMVTSWVVPVARYWLPSIILLMLVRQVSAPDIQMLLPISVPVVA
jgi:hypothetical protein